MRGARSFLQARRGDTMLCIHRDGFSGDMRAGAQTEEHRCRYIRDSTRSHKEEMVKVEAVGRIRKTRVHEQFPLLMLWVAARAGTKRWII
nr:hypothetical protein CFP56_34905 [Quercus suber]